MTTLNSTTLRKAAMACRLRDKNTCAMCGRVGGTIEAHHVKPKSLFPELAYMLNNLISLCMICHRGIVHAGNSFDLNNWQNFVPMFRRFMNLAYRRDWNDKYQNRIN